jgi:hypothetical protein
MRQRQVCQILHPNIPPPPLPTYRAVLQPLWQPHGVALAGPFEGLKCLAHHHQAVCELAHRGDWHQPLPQQLLPHMPAAQKVCPAAGRSGRRVGGEPEGPEPCGRPCLTEAVLAAAAVCSSRQRAAAAAGVSLLHVPAAEQGSFPAHRNVLAPLQGGREGEGRW